MSGDDRTAGGPASSSGAVSSENSSGTFGSALTHGTSGARSSAGPSAAGADSNGSHETAAGPALRDPRPSSSAGGGWGGPSDHARHAASATKFATLRGNDDDDDDEEGGGGAMATSEMRALYKEASAFEGVAVISMIEREVEEQPDKVEKALEITMEDGVTLTVELDSGEKRLNDLGYKQELKRDMVGGPSLPP